MNLLPWIFLAVCLGFLLPFAIWLLTSWESTGRSLEEIIPPKRQTRQTDNPDETVED